LTVLPASILNVSVRRVYNWRVIRTAYIRPQQNKEQTVNKESRLRDRCRNGSVLRSKGKSGQSLKVAVRSTLYPRPTWGLESALCSCQKAMILRSKAKTLKSSKLRSKPRSHQGQINIKQEPHEVVDNEISFHFKKCHNTNNNNNCSDEETEVTFKSDILIREKLLTMVIIYQDLLLFDIKQEVLNTVKTKDHYEPECKFELPTDCKLILNSQSSRRGRRRKKIFHW
jgi:hypothetical protein